MNKYLQKFLQVIRVNLPGVNGALEFYFLNLNSLTFPGQWTPCEKPKSSAFQHLVAKRII